MVDIKDKQWPDWSDFHANGGAHNQESVQSQPLKKTGKGSEIIDGQFEDMVSDITQGFEQPGIRQPTDEELFGHLVVSEEELTKQEESWDNLLIKWEQLAKSTQVDDNQNEEWGNGRSHNSYLSEDEVRQRNKYIGDH